MMLDRDIAQKKLEAVWVPGWRASLKRTLDSLRVTPETRALLSRVLRRDIYGCHPYELLGAFDRPRRRWLRVDTQEQLALLRRLFPRMADDIALAWKGFDRAPYQVGEGGRAFRAPGHNAAAAVRSTWFSAITAILGGFDEDAEWLAAWAPHLGSLPGRSYFDPGDCAPLLAAAIDAGGPRADRILDILRSSASGTHDVGLMGHHVIRSLLSCSRPDAWEFMEKLLLAARREEGLRQSILECADEAHPDAFRRLLRVILDEDLTRFSAVVRAVNVWFGLSYDSVSAKHADALIDAALTALNDPDARERLVAGDDPEKAYVALWSVAFEDAPAAVRRVRALLRTKASPGHRFVAYHLLRQIELPECIDALAAGIDDPDLRAASHAFSGWTELTQDYSAILRGGDARPDPECAQSLQRLLDRIDGKRKRLTGDVFPWVGTSIDAAAVLAQLVRNVPASRVRSLLPNLSRMNPETRANLVFAVSGVSDSVLYKKRSKRTTPPALLPAGKTAESQKPIGETASARGRKGKATPGAADPDKGGGGRDGESGTGGTRACVLDLLGDGSPEVRRAAFAVMNSCEVFDDEVERIESLLERSPSDLRTASIRRLLSQDDQAVLRSAGRLLAGDARQRPAGLELLRALHASGREASAAAAAARAWRDHNPGRTASEEELSAFAAKPDTRTYTLENGLGLIDFAAQPDLPTILASIAPRSPASPATLTTPVESRAPRAAGLMRLASRLTGGSGGDGGKLGRGGRGADGEGGGGASPDGNTDPAAPGTRGCDVLWSLDAFVHAHKDAEIQPKSSDDSESGDRGPYLLGGDDIYRMDHPTCWTPIEKNRAAVPPEVARLIETWMSQQSPNESRDLAHRFFDAWLQIQLAHGRCWAADKTWPLPSGKFRKPNYERAVELLVHWGLCIHGDTALIHEMLDRAEDACARGLVNRGNQWKVRGKQSRSTASLTPRFASDWAKVVSRCFIPCDDRAIIRLVRLARASEAARGSWEEQLRTRLAHIEPDEHVRRSDASDSETTAAFINLDSTDFVHAWRVGAVGEQDLFRWALMPEQVVRWDFRPDDARVPSMPFLPSLVRERPDSAGASDAWPDSLLASVEKLTDRVLDIEFARGDAPTQVSRLAAALKPSGGASVLMRALRTLGPNRIVRQPGYNDPSRGAVCTSIISHSRPGEGDTPQRLAELAREHAVPLDRLYDVAVLSPQWAALAERVLDAPGLEDAVWWIRAHTKDESWRYDYECADKWDAMIAERTPVHADDLHAGAVDPAWFARAYAALGPQRWDRLYESAKYACSNAGHKRAQLFADAMLDRATHAQLVERINAKRHQESVRALGLVPLPAGDAAHACVLERYRLMQEFRRTSRKHGGSMLQASEKRAVEIGMENLARTAGYPDPLRLQWAMDTREVEDLARGPVTVTVGPVVVSLSVDDVGAPSLSSVKAGKALAALPPAARKHADVKTLSLRLADLRRQRSRMRLALEQAMCRGDAFRAAELASLFDHPMLRPMIERLVFVGPGGAMGYPLRSSRGCALKDPAGRIEPLAPKDHLRIAHPADLLGIPTRPREARAGDPVSASPAARNAVSATDATDVGGRGRSGDIGDGTSGNGAGVEWREWQRECFAAERVQPFKQVFRELYLPTENERSLSESRRHQSQQVHPRRAMALLSARGWVVRPEEGVARTFHAEHITAHLEFEEYFHTPGEIEGLTIRGVRFRQSSRTRDIPLADVSPRLFSEVMRDIDLVVSVAHRGGVDPEASQSTTQMRAALLREVCGLLKLGNVVVEDRFAKIAGSRANYAVHLGSATVQMLPGGSLIISPVLSQHRGRIFLPFADDDPKSAEVVTKVITLARDADIKDPNILAQIRP